MKKIALLGAFDRFNYGDLLFPIIIEKSLKKSNSIKSNYQIEFYGLKESDLSEYGAKKTQSIKKLFQKDNLPEKSSLIIVGGEVLGSGWDTMLSHFGSEYGNFIMKILRKIFGKNNINNLSRRVLNGKTKLPWIIGEDDFGSNINVIYNTVGGTGFNYLDESYKKEIIKKINNSSFFSVREEKTKNHMVDVLDSRNDIFMSPDSAIVMSQYFSTNFLESKLSNNVRTFINECQDYVAFQSGLKYSKGNEKIISNQLEKIHKKTGLNVLLIPIGRAGGHSDHIGMKRIKDNINIPVEIPENCNIYDIMYLIAKSELFMGTSLHGNITAISFGVPNIGLDKRVSKLDSFLKTWDIIDGKGTIDFKDIFNRFEIVYNYNKKELESKKKELITLANNNFDKISNIIIDS